MKIKYRALLFHPEGDYVIDFNGNSKNEIWDRVNDMGSRWIFYPIVFIATDKTIVDTLPGLEHLNNKRIKTVSKYLNDLWQDNSEEICDIINNGLPLSWIYQ